MDCDILILPTAFGERHLVYALRQDSCEEPQIWLFLVFVNMLFVVCTCEEMRWAASTYFFFLVCFGEMPGFGEILFWAPVKFTSKS